MALRGELRSVVDLNETQRSNMFDLMTQYYDNVPRAEFESDLAEKTDLALVFDHDTIVGFSTIRVDAVDTSSGPVRVLFSGDTIVDRSARTANPLARLVLEYGLTQDRAGGAPLYWFLITKGFRTYRYLPLLFEEFSPCFDASTPALEQEVIDGYGAARWPNLYDRARGVLVAPEESCRLIAGEAPITKERRADPHVAFFEAKNPRHAIGDELCCVARVSESNLTPAGNRIARRFQTV